MKVNLKLSKDDEGVVCLCDDNNEAILWIKPYGKIVMNGEKTMMHDDYYYYLPELEFNIGAKSFEMKMPDTHGACFED